MQKQRMSTVQLNFGSVEGDLHIKQECLAPSEDKKISPDISSYVEYVQTQPRIMQRRATL